MTRFRCDDNADSDNDDDDDINQNHDSQSKYTVIDLGFSNVLTRPQLYADSRHFTQLSFFILSASAEKIDLIFSV